MKTIISAFFILITFSYAKGQIDTNNITNDAIMIGNIDMNSVIIHVYKSKIDVYPYKEFVIVTDPTTGLKKVIDNSIRGKTSKGGFIIINGLKDKSEIEKMVEGDKFYEEIVLKDVIDIEEYEEIINDYIKENIIEENNEVLNTTEFIDSVKVDNNPTISDIMPSESINNPTEIDNTITLNSATSNFEPNSLSNINAEDEEKVDEEIIQNELSNFEEEKYIIKEDIKENIIEENNEVLNTTEFIDSVEVVKNPTVSDHMPQEITVVLSDIVNNVPINEASSNQEPNSLSNINAENEEKVDEEIIQNELSNYEAEKYIIKEDIKENIIEENNEVLNTTEFIDSVEVDNNPTNSDHMPQEITVVLSNIVNNVPINEASSNIEPNNPSNINAENEDKVDEEIDLKDENDIEESESRNDDNIKINSISENMNVMNKKDEIDRDEVDKTSTPNYKYPQQFKKSQSDIGNNIPLNKASTNLDPNKLSNVYAENVKEKQPTKIVKSISTENTKNLITDKLDSKSTIKTKASTKKSIQKNKKNSTYRIKLAKNHYRKIKGGKFKTNCYSF